MNVIPILEQLVSDKNLICYGEGVEGDIKISKR